MEERRGAWRRRRFALDAHGRLSCWLTHPDDRHAFQPGWATRECGSARAGRYAFRVDFDHPVFLSPAPRAAPRPPPPPTVAPTRVPTVHSLPPSRPAPRGAARAEPRGTARAEGAARAQLSLPEAQGPHRRSKLVLAASDPADKARPPSPLPPVLTGHVSSLLPY